MLDGRAIYDMHDPDDIGHGIANLAEQVRQGWQESCDLSCPRGYAEVSEVVVAGMGGSALAPEIVHAAWETKLDRPAVLVRGYVLPPWVGPHTLVVLSSFSGETEEVLSCAQIAAKRGAKIAVMTSGGRLLKLAESKRWPTYRIHPGDLAPEPRFGVGFSLGGYLGLLACAGILAVKDSDIDRLMIVMREVVDTCAVDVAESENPAKQVARALKDRVILAVGAEHLAGVTHTAANQFNETAKVFAVPSLLPELNHHLLESFSHPKALGSKSTALLFSSSRYHPRVQKRVKVTADLFESLDVGVIEYTPQAAKPWEEAAEVLQFTSYVSWYLAMLYSENPRPNPFVNEFKKKMGKGER